MFAPKALLIVEDINIYEDKRVLEFFIMSKDD